MAYSWFILLISCAGAAFVLLLWEGTSAGKIVHERIADKAPAQTFSSSVSFFLAFAGVRAVVFAVLHNVLVSFHRTRRAAYSSPMKQ